MALEQIVFLALDPGGRLVVLTRERLDHIRSRHPEIADVVHVLLRGVREPDHILPGRGEDEEWLYVAGVGPSRWLKVVVVWDVGGTGRIITAIPRREKP